MRLSFSSALMCDNKPVVSVLSNTSAGGRDDHIFFCSESKEAKA
jgi:hypothetical protein